MTRFDIFSLSHGQKNLTMHRVCERLRFIVSLMLIVVMSDDLRDAKSGSRCLGREALLLEDQFSYKARLKVVYSYGQCFKRRYAIFSSY